MTRPQLSISLLSLLPLASACGIDQEDTSDLTEVAEPEFRVSVTPWNVMYTEIPGGEFFVASGAVLYKFNGADTGPDMFADHELGYQLFPAQITTVKYINQHTLVGLADGRILKVSGTGGQGDNMFKVNSVNGSCGFTGTNGFNHYLGSYKFSAGIVDITPVGNHTLISLENGNMLKVSGDGGGGCNMFAVQESNCGFTSIPGYNYVVGSQKFNSPIVDVTPVSGYTFVSLANGKMLKVNGHGGSGCNMFAAQESGCGFTSIPGYNYLVGSQSFGSAVVNVTQVGAKTLVSLGDGSMLKINGVGGGGCNMFAVQQSSCGWASLPGYNYLVGSQSFYAPVVDALAVDGRMLVGLGDGSLLKVSGTGGGGCNMFAVQESSCGFSGIPNYPYYIGSQLFDSGVSDLAVIGQDTYVSVDEGKWLRVAGTGGGGCNMFAIEETFNSFESVPGYNYYLGHQG